MTSIELYNLSKPSNRERLGWNMDVDFLTFPGGEEHVTIPTYQSKVKTALVVAHLQTGQDIMRYRCLMELLREHGTSSFYVFAPYVPGARADIPSNEPLTAASVKTYVEALECIDGINFFILDPHSPVTPAVFNSYVTVLSPIDAIASFNKEWDGFICPDAGAEKRTFAVAQHFNRPVAYCRKHRDTATGALTDFEVPSGLRGRWLIVDDICDGGGTFMGLGSKLKEQNPDLQLDLYVTHGIFSGKAENLWGYFNSIYTTNSWNPDIECLGEGILNVADVCSVYGPQILREIYYDRRNSTL